MGYCKKHDQEFMEHVHECPICVGERLAPAYVSDSSEPSEPVRRRRRRPAAPARPKKKKPEKKGLF